MQGIFIHKNVQSIVLKIGNATGLPAGRVPFPFDGTLDGRQIVAFRVLDKNNTSGLFLGNTIATVTSLRGVTITLVDEKTNEIMSNQPATSLTQSVNAGQLFTFPCKFSTRQSFLNVRASLSGNYFAIEIFYL